MMQMGFVERLPPDFSGLQNRQRLALRPCENFQGPNGTDADSRANIGKQRQYQGSDTDTEQALIPGSLIGCTGISVITPLSIVVFSKTLSRWRKLA